MNVSAVAPVRPGGNLVAEEVLVPAGEHLIPGGVSDRFRVKCYLRICDLFFDLLSYMTTLTLVVLPVVVSLLH